MAQYDANVLTKALAAAARAFLATLEPTTTPLSIVPRVNGDNDETLFYDPLTDEPPYPAKPKGTADEEKMTSLAFLGAVARINAEKKRGATSEEVTFYARKAGYSGGNAVTGWNSTKTGSKRVIENIDGYRILNEGGHRYVKELAKELGISLHGDYTELSVLS